ncbi:hypothetical protein EDD86DRAFT_268223 [Gorgonomyces haynaldii]|nr:hypothetical protein EDD86DRAFT_268223 [Gorgonomyces haynaldii]
MSRSKDEKANLVYNIGTQQRVAKVPAVSYLNKEKAQQTANRKFGKSKQMKLLPQLYKDILVHEEPPAIEVVEEPVKERKPSIKPKQAPKRVLLDSKLLEENAAHKRSTQEKAVLVRSGFAQSETGRLPAKQDTELESEESLNVFLVGTPVPQIIKQQKLPSRSPSVVPEIQEPEPEEEESIVESETESEEEEEVLLELEPAPISRSRTPEPVIELGGFDEIESLQAKLQARLEERKRQLYGITEPPKPEQPKVEEIVPVVAEPVIQYISDAATPVQSAQIEEEQPEDTPEPESQDVAPVEERIQTQTTESSISKRSTAPEILKFDQFDIQEDLVPHEKPKHKTEWVQPPKALRLPKALDLTLPQKVEKKRKEFMYKEELDAEMDLQRPAFGLEITGNSQIQQEKKVPMVFAPSKPVPGRISIKMQQETLVPPIKVPQTKEDTSFDDFLKLSKLAAKHIQEQRSATPSAVRPSSTLPASVRPSSTTPSVRPSSTTPSVVKHSSTETSIVEPQNQPEEETQEEQIHNLQSPDASKDSSMENTTFILDSGLLVTDSLPASAAGSRRGSMNLNPILSTHSLRGSREHVNSKRTSKDSTHRNSREYVGSKQSSRDSVKLGSAGSVRGLSVSVSSDIPSFAVNDTSKSLDTLEEVPPPISSSLYALTEHSFENRSDRDSRTSVGEDGRGRRRSILKKPRTSIQEDSSGYETEEIIHESRVSIAEPVEKPLEKIVEQEKPKRPRSVTMSGYTSVSFRHPDSEETDHNRRASVTAVDAAETEALARRPIFSMSREGTFRSKTGTSRFDIPTISFTDDITHESDVKAGDRPKTATFLRRESSYKASSRQSRVRSASTTADGQHDPEIQKIAETMDAKAIWGRERTRKASLGKKGSFSMPSTPLPPSKFARTIESVIAKTRRQLGRDSIHSDSNGSERNSEYDYGERPDSGGGRKLWGMVKHVVAKQVIAKKFTGRQKAAAAHTYLDPLGRDKRMSLLEDTTPRYLYQQQRMRFQFGKDKPPTPYVLKRRPVIGVAVKPEDAGIIASDTDGKAEQNSKLIRLSMDANGITEDKALNNMFEIVHGMERRIAGLTAMERVKYPTYEDLGPPLDATDTPILEYDEEENALLVEEQTWKELGQVDSAVEASTVPVPSHLRKRGILLARVGKFLQAEADLDKAIVYDPFNSDAYWHRHQLHLRTNDVESALRDLDAITANNKLHLGAFQAKARIYQAIGILKLAVINYSNVIKLKPGSVDAYYNRAMVFEAMGETSFANEDYRVLRGLDPTNEAALYNLALYNFSKRLWNDSLQAFLKLLILAPENAEYLVYKGRVYAHLARFNEAFDALSLAISIDPDNAGGYFHRGCLLRDVNPRWAIDNLSISILLEDSKANAEAYYQRGALYARLQEHDLALIDLQAAIALESTHAKCYLEMGILYMRYFNEHEKALESFNKCLSCDPIFLKAYLCRGELYERMIAAAQKSLLQESGKHSERIKWQKTTRLVAQYSESAIREYSRAIRLYPNKYLLYLHRGSLLLKQGMMPEATCDFHAAFDLNSSIAQTFMQRILILSFQRRYQQIIKEFEERRKAQTVRRLDDPALLILVAKARIHCDDFTGALNDLNSVVDQGVRSDPNIYLQRGICYEYLEDWNEASNQFTLCINFAPHYAKAYYHRGLCKIYVKQKGGVDDLDLAIQHDPKFFDAYLSRASYYQQIGDFEKGVDDCNMALQLEPTSIRALLLRGICRTRMGDQQRALADFTKAITFDKASAYAFFNRAIAYEMLGDYDNAIKDYSIVLLISEDFKAYRNRALIYWEKGDHENALLDLFAARDHYPNDPKLRGLLGLMLKKMNRLDESLEEYTMAIKMSPYMKDVILGRGNVYAAMGDLESSRRDYCRVLHYFPTCAEAYVNIAYTQQTASLYKQAWVTFSMALALDENCVPALEGRAMVCLTMDNPLVALLDITKAHKLSPNDPEILTNRGVIFEALDDTISALQQYKQALSKNPRFELALFNAGNLYLKQRLWEEAVVYYNRALEETPKDTMILLNRGIAYLMMHQTQMAMESFNAALKVDPKNAQVRYNKGILLQLMGKYPASEQEFGKVIELCPQDSGAYLKRGDARSKQNRWKDAMEDYAQHISTQDE